MKFKHKCVGHPNKAADGKFQGLPFCSDCIKELKRSKGTKSKKPIGVWTEVHVFSIGNMKVYRDVLVKI